MRHVEQCLNKRNCHIDTKNMMPHHGFGKVVLTVFDNGPVDSYVRCRNREDISSQRKMNLF